MCTQQFDIVVALTQRRDLNRNNRQAVVQVFAESAVLNHPLQIAVSSCQNSTVGGNGGAAADSFEGFFLQRMQYTRLGCKTHIADFVEKSVPPCAISNLPLRIDLASVKAPAS